MDRQDDVAPELLEPQPLGPERPSRLSPRVLSTGACTVLIAAGIFLIHRDRPDSVGGAETLAPRPAQGLVVPIAPSNRIAFEDAINGLRLSDPEKARIRASVKTGDLEVGLVTLWDWQDHDGDVVALTSAGFVQNISIGEMPTPVVIAYRVPGDLTLTGLRDGGGGITVALETGAEPLRLRALRTGESLRVRIP